MIIKTEFGNFNNFSDLLKFMTYEKKKYVFIDSCDFFGCELIYSKTGTSFSFSEIEIIVNKEVSHDI